jgi:hypothetical protein
MRVFMLGAVIHLAWRAVGGSARVMNTLGAFVYVYSLMSLLVAGSQILSTGVLRIWAPDVVDELMRGLYGGRALESIRRSTDFFSAHPARALAFYLVLASWPLFVVPFVSWGAFRTKNNVSRVRSGIAAALSLMLGTLGCSS